MRDYLAAIRERTVVFDGGMGATLEQFDLSLEEDYRLPGRCHEALVLNRPDVIEGVHASMVEAGAEVLETDTFQASRLKLGEWGLAEHTLRDQPQGGARSPGARPARTRFVAGSIGPTGFLPASDDPTLGQIGFAELREVFAEQASGLIAGGADLIIIETTQDILELKAAVFGIREAFGEAGRAGADPVQRLAAAQRRQDAAGHRHQRRRWRPSRALESTPSGSTARPAPRTCATRSASWASSARSRSTASRTPACRCRARTARRSSPRSPGPLAEVLGDFVDRYGISIVGGCCGTTPDAHRGDRRADPRPGSPAAAPPAPGPRQLDDRRDPARAVATPDAGRRAGQLAGLAQGQGDAARRRLRRPARRRRGPGRRRRPRARRLRRAHRAPGRGRPDARGRQADLARRSPPRSRSTPPSPT